MMSTGHVTCLNRRNCSLQQHLNYQRIPVGMRINDGHVRSYFFKHAACPVDITQLSPCNSISRKHVQDLISLFKRGRSRLRSHKKPEGYFGVNIFLSLYKFWVCVSKVFFPRRQSGLNICRMPSPSEYLCAMSSLYLQNCSSYDTYLTGIYHRFHTALLSPEIYTFWLFLYTKKGKKYTFSRLRLANVP